MCVQLKTLLVLSLSFVAIFSQESKADGNLVVELNDSGQSISVRRKNEDKPIVTQNAKSDFRPYIHPIVAPDGKGVLTEYSPGHHKHQTGLYWGFTRVNGRDFFHHPEGSYWRRVSVKVLNDGSDSDGLPSWQTVYDMLDEHGQTIMTETQVWTIHEHHGEYILDLEWTGEAKTDVTIGKYDYGGLFLRMPWRKGIAGEVVNGARQRGARAEGQRAIWVDVGMEIEGRDDLAHIAIFDHSKNEGFPQPWRVDGQMGVGPVRARLGDWKIKKGEKHTIRHQVVVYTGKLNDVALTNKWGDFSGQKGTWAQWGIAQKEGRQAEFLTPERAVEAMTLKDGFDVNVYASEPMMTQPMAFCWDDRGRMWIAENRDYETRGTGFAKYGDSRVSILEDTNGDGVADSKKVFLEGIPFPSAIAVGMDGLWLGAPPNLLFIPDRNKDDVADYDDIEIRLTGWGIRDRHETLNSFHWGPDGWLYGCQGFATPSTVGKPVGKGKLYRHGDPFPKNIPLDGPGTEINGGVWRYHPTKDRFEVVAPGFSNPWGIDYDAKGQFFITACVIPHLWHVVPGGIYHRQGGRHFNPYVYSDIRTIADHRHRSAHGGARIYISDAFPDEYKNRIFMANIHEHAVLTDVLEPKGSGFVGHHGDDLLLANNAQWIGFSVEIGPEGAVYILDWHDADICGKEVLNKDTGRIFRITPTKSAAKDWEGRYADLNAFSDIELVKLQESESAWHARRARIILQNRASKNQIKSDARDALLNNFRAHANADYRLRNMWALHATGGVPEKDLMTALSDSDQYIRAWAIQLLCEDFNASDAAISRFLQMAANDQSPVVRLYLASAMQRVAPETRWKLASSLVGHSVDADDHNIPKMIWFGIESSIVESPEKSVRLAAESQIPLVTRQIARRLADGQELETLVNALSTDKAHQLDLLLGMRDAFDGQFDVVAPGNWASVFAKLQSAEADVAKVAVELSLHFDDKISSERMLATMKNQNATSQDRARAIQGLAAQKNEELKRMLPGLLNNSDLRVAAIRAIASFDDRDFGSLLLDSYDRFDSATKLEVIHTMASRQSYGMQLTAKLKSEEIPKRDIPAYVARLLQRVVGNGFLEVWGPIESLSSDSEAAFLKYRRLLSESALSDADLSQGRAVFKKTCQTCHKLYGEGGNIGPDITGANRTNLEYLLGNVLTPSAIIQDAYKMHVILTDDGLAISGVLAAENDRHISLRVAGQDEPKVIPKSKIESREVAPVSMMPDGLLKNLSDEEVVNLIAYLRNLRQVSLP